MISKILHREEITYTTPHTEAVVKQKLVDLYHQPTMHVAGGLTNDHEFTAEDQQNVVAWIMPNLKRKAAYLKGKITPQSNGTRIQLQVNPNPAMPIFALAAATIGVVTLALAPYFAEVKPMLLISGVLFLGLGVIYYPLSGFFKNRLRNKVVNHLELKKG